MPITLICLDADDTLWHNETFFRTSFGAFADLMAPFGPAEAVQARLDATEHKNLAAYGYGAKGFILSMLEAASDIAGDDLPAATVRDILALGRSMLQCPIDPLPGVEAALPELADRGRLVLVTKGDLHHQEAKLAASGLGHHFDGVEVVSDKCAATYARVFARYATPAEQVVMAGNSVRSDILPVLEAGGWAALVPYDLVWAHEAADPPQGHARFAELATLGALPAWIDRISAAATTA